MSNRIFHLSLNIAGFMQENKFPDGYDIFQRDDGTPMSPGAAFTYLNAEQAKGHKVIPCSSKCGNPCAQTGCAGFDYQGGGCPGHPINESPKNED